MRQCISIIGMIFRNLWRTLKGYVCKRRKVEIKDIDGDQIPDFVIRSNVQNENKLKEE